MSEAFLNFSTSVLRFCSLYRSCEMDLMLLGDFSVMV